MYEYGADFYRYLSSFAARSARVVVPRLTAVLPVHSVVDFGCGQGAWLSVWRSAGASIVGVDGPYVDPSRLLIDAAAFHAADLTKPIGLGRRFDLVQSLEVAEHLPATKAEQFIETLTAHGALVLFSAAIPGQGGENHINERPLSFWQDIFRTMGFAAYDIVRPAFRADSSVEPWYRFNTVLYANERVRASLPAAVAHARVEPGRLNEIGDIGWQARKSILRLLPNTTGTLLSKWNYRRLSRAHKRRSAG